MKEEILKILDTYSPNVIKELPLDKNKLYLIGERESAISQLTALMCYREVRAYWVCNTQIGSINVSDEEAWKECEEYLIGYYHRDVLTKAIEQVKNELK